MFPVPFVSPERDVKVSKPNGIFNKGMAIGAIVAGILAIALPTVVSLGVVTASITLAGLAAGMVTEKIMRIEYNQALKQKAIHEAAQQAKTQEESVSQYKNIHDLEKATQPEHDVNNWSKSVAKSATIDYVSK